MFKCVEPPVYAFDTVMVYSPAVVPKSVLNCPRQLLHRPRDDGTTLIRALHLTHTSQTTYTYQTQGTPHTHLTNNIHLPNTRYTPHSPHKCNSHLTHIFHTVLLIPKLTSHQHGYVKAMHFYLWHIIPDTRVFVKIAGTFLSVCVCVWDCCSIPESLS